jgi:hypothetical protein
MSSNVNRMKNFVDGKLVEGMGGEWREVINPATGTVIAEVPEGAEEDVERAVEAADRAFASWFETTPGERAEMLFRLADVMEENAGELASLESRNVGKPISLAREELPFMIDNLRFFAGAGRVLEGKAAGEYLRGYTSMIRREPVGVVGQIAPWNYPLHMAIWKIDPALAAGNTVVLKPSEQTPPTMLRLMELAADVFPPGVLNVITGDGVPVGSGIVSHPKVGMVSLTGDVATGKEVARHRGLHRGQARHGEDRLREARGDKGAKVGGHEQSHRGRPGRGDRREGAREGAIGFVSNVVIGVGCTAPGYSLAATLGFVAAIVGVRSPAILWIAFIPMLFIASAYYYMNRAVTDAGTAFAWITEAMGPYLGWLGSSPRRWRA